MSHLTKIIATNNLLNSVPTSSHGLRAVSHVSPIGRSTVTLSRPVWEPIGKDRWSTFDKDFDGAKTLSTVAYTRKLQGEEELRKQTMAFQVPITEIVKQRPNIKYYTRMLNEL